MGATYKIFGKTFQSHQLAIATLLTVGAVGFVMTEKGNKSVESPNLQAKLQSGASEAAKSNSEDINVEKLLTELIEENDETVN
ncbi:similar to Saccharomyces cerevisiae YOR020W-A Putative protein of unknown function, conserved in A. gossypii [Maudiozyma barnettii]|uniref:Uncharacterized protein n=1 Tax=Maudiozyma barnettii TaxID=61262 RepID=A0A8H2VIR7_9SACH|nr:Mco10p [Kazachstania barnettii]CAB4256310.1 similar to Saccharomyces cerevisiae YOR020W-A Putative protein of unknown function, conserved in A. gossypii [Kazachstania barnettii]CAD1784919.1 similar to Saccharomyces cerevisiae YOR020W-A Putative protein of unknown function, conserved in A. gossypii [Kazachstania barnettii]